MNNIFDIKRFGLLAKKDLAENWKKYMLALLLMLGVTSILFIWVSTNYYENVMVYMEGNSSRYNYLSESLFVVGMLLFLIYGCLSASWLMDPIRDKTRKIAYLTNPASTFEKYLIRWGLLVVLFLFLYAMIFFVADFVQWLVSTVCYPELDVKSLDMSVLIGKSSAEYNPIFREWKLLFMAFSIYFFIQSLFILGATFWPKNTFIKTFCAGFIIFLIYIVLCWGIIAALFDNGMSGFTDVVEDVLVRNNQDRFTYIITGGFSFFAVLNWVLGYFRFRETEVIKRI